MDGLAEAVKRRQLRVEGTLVTVYKPKGGITWRYDFSWQGQRHQDTTGQLTKKAAQQVEDRIKRRLREGAWGLAARPEDTPRIADWAEVAAAHQAAAIERADLQVRFLARALEFWGAKPKTDPETRPTSGKGSYPARWRGRERGPYYDLRLGDPIADPTWLDRFDTWMAAHDIAGSNRNQLLSACSMLYRVALLPKYRATAGVVVNPFRDIPRDRTRTRTVVLSLQELRDWIAASAPHVRLALAIGALAPKLRIRNILELRWDADVDAALTKIEVVSHKTASHTGLPLVVLIDPQLRRILEAARTAQQAHLGGGRPGDPVIQWRKREGKTVRPVKDIKKALAGAANRSGLAYGLKVNGATFHSLRHTMATWLAELEVPERLRQDVMGHLELRTTQKYTHLRPLHEVKPLGQLSARTPLEDLIGATGLSGGLSGVDSRRAKTLSKSRTPQRAPKVAKVRSGQ